MSKFMSAILKNVPDAQCAVNDDTGELMAWISPMPQPTQEQVQQWYADYAPAPSIPTSVIMRQCRLQLLADGVYAAVDNAVPSMGMAAVIEWEYASEVQRDNPLVPGIQQLLGWDDARVDRFYAEASTL